MFIRLGKHFPVMVVGHNILEKYKIAGAQVDHLVISLMSAENVASPLLLSKTGQKRQTRLLSVSRLAPEKGLVVLLDAVICMRLNNLDICLDIVGEGPERDSLEQVTHRLNIKDFVTFHGYLPFGESLEKAYNHADIFIFHSFTEGIPQVLVEAMAYGLPIVASAVGGIPHLIKDGENGLLVSPGSSKTFAWGVEQLIKDIDLRNRIVKGAYITALQLTREKQILRITNQLLRQMGGNI